jgi:dipeptidyl aminopeptidase/acylaminoacyl peptidase
MTDKNSKRTFTPIDELRIKTIQSARLSPNGKQVVYALKQNDPEQDTTSTQLWLLDVHSGEQHQITHQGNQNSSPEWSPDGKQIAFRSDRAEKNQIYILPLEGGEARQFTHLEQGVGGGPRWSPDGNSIAFTAGPKEQPYEPGKPYRITRFVYRFDGIGYLDPAVQNVFVQSLDTDEARQLTQGKGIARDLKWSPDGRQILYLEAADPGRFELFSAKIKTVDLEGDDREVLGLDWGWIAGASWSADGKRILFSGNKAGKPMGSKADLWALDPASGKMESRTAGLKYGNVYGFGNVLPLDENHVLGEVLRAGMGETYRIAISGPEAIEPILQGERSASLQDLGKDAILFIQNTPANPSELALASLDGQNEKLLTTNNLPLLEEIDMPEVKTLRFDNGQGIEIEGWIMLPPHGEAPYPLILYIHGGPHGAYGYSYRPDFNMLAGAGFAVLYPNPRGSAGYGDEFSAALSGNWGVMDYVDLMAGVDYVIEKGLADPDRMGVCGLSYGGYLTTFTVGQTERFKAAVAENPITDLVSRYGTADMGPWGSLGEIGGKPHEIPEVYRRSSPITYAHKCTTPTLLVQGENDYRCPAGQSEQFYTTLKANGCIAEMVRLPEMPHVGSINGPVPVQKAQNEALLDWMKRYVLAEED